MSRWQFESRCAKPLLHDARTILPSLALAATVHCERLPKVYAQHSILPYKSEIYASVHTIHSVSAPLKHFVQLLEARYLHNDAASCKLSRGQQSPPVTSNEQQHAVVQVGQIG
jgi:hypothetical protein